jgi:hypothetical protein
LGETASIEIVRENLNATQTFYFVAMLEELRLFQVVDRLVERFAQGLLPVGTGPAGEILYRYWKRRADRFTEAERRNLYARVFGWPGGDEGGTPNREFADLWLRFVSAVTTYAEQLQRGTPLSQQAVRESARDLAGNLSLHGYGLAYFAARELQQEIQEIITLLSNNEIKTAFGARDMWQVIEQVATLDLGGSPNILRQRTRAGAGSAIIRWLANRRSLLLSARPVNVLKDAVIGKRRSGPKPATDPNDYDLVNACEQWLAVTGTPDTPSDG